MNKYEMIAMIATVVTIGATVSTIARAFFMRAGGGKAQQQQVGRATAADADRLERIERAVEAVAIEVERISEAQRFTTRLLSERNGAGVGAAAGAQRRDASSGGHGAD